MLEYMFSVFEKNSATGKVDREALLQGDHLLDSADTLNMYNACRAVSASGLDPGHLSIGSGAVSTWMESDISHS